MVNKHKDASNESMFNVLSKLDTDGDGAFRMEDLLRVMEDQQQMSPRGVFQDEAEVPAQD